MNYMELGMSVKKVIATLSAGIILSGCVAPHAPAEYGTKWTYDNQALAPGATNVATVGAELPEGVDPVTFTVCGTVAGEVACSSVIVKRDSEKNDSSVSTVGSGKATTFNVLVTVDGKAMTTVPSWSEVVSIVAETKNTGAQPIDPRLTMVAPKGVRFTTASKGQIS